MHLQHWYKYRTVFYNLRSNLPQNWTHCSLQKSVNVIPTYCRKTEVTTHTCIQRLTNYHPTGIKAQCTRSYVAGALWFVHCNPGLWRQARRHRIDPTPPRTLSTLRWQPPSPDQRWLLFPQTPVQSLSPRTQPQFSWDDACKWRLGAVWKVTRFRLILHESPSPSRIWKS